MIIIIFKTNSIKWNGNKIQWWKKEQKKKKKKKSVNYRETEREAKRIKRENYIYIYVDKQTQIE